MTAKGRAAKVTVSAFAVLTPPSLLAWAVNFRLSSLVFVIGFATYTIIIVVFALLRQAAHQLLEHWSDRLSDALLRNSDQLFSLYGKRVLRYVAAANSYIENKGISNFGGSTLSLDEVFINLDLDASAPDNLEVNPIKYGEGRQIAGGHDIWHWILQARIHARALVIVGPPGSGKTTLLRHITHVIALRRVHISGRAAGKIPITVALRDHAQRFGVAEPSLADIIREELRDVDGEPEGWIERRLEQGRFLVLLDGLDEVASAELRELLAKWVDRQQRRYSSTTFVVTSRPFGYKSNQLSSALVLQVKNFTSSQVEWFVKSWYEAIIDRELGSKNADAARIIARKESDDLIRRLHGNLALDNLAANPLLLTLIANVHHYRGALPGTRGELYKEVCEVFLGARHRARGVALDMQASQKQELLQVLALEMMATRTRDITPGAAEQLLADMLSEISPGVDVKEFLGNVESSSGLLIEREVGEYAFSHHTFQEYLAAIHLSHLGVSKVHEIDVEDAWWHETLRLYCAQADATPVVEMCITKGSSNPSVLALVVDCIESAHRLNPQVREKLWQMINPPNLQDDTEARRIAGQVQMLLRVRELTRVGDDLHISPTPITRLEYQLFLDQQRNPRQHCPDHWANSMFEEGSAHSPLVGLRPEDALAFSSWFNRQISDNYTYRLASRAEMSSKEVREALNGKDVQVAVALVHEDAHVSPTQPDCGVVVLRVIDDFQLLNAISTCTNEDTAGIFRLGHVINEVLPEIELNLIERVVARSSSSRRFSKSDDDLNFRPLKDLIVPDGFLAWIESVSRTADLTFVDAAREMPALDVGVLFRAAGITFDYFDNAMHGITGPNLPSNVISGHTIDRFEFSHEPTSDLAVPTEARLAVVTAWQWFALLSGASRATLRRDVLAKLRPETSANLRFVARVSAMILAYISEIHNEDIRISMAGHRSRRRPSYEEKEYRLPRTKFFLDIYAMFALLEGRILNRCPATEGIYIVRSSGSDFEVADVAAVVAQIERVGRAASLAGRVGTLPLANKRKGDHG